MKTKKEHFWTLVHTYTHSLNNFHLTMNREGEMRNKNKEKKEQQSRFAELKKKISRARRKLGINMEDRIFLLLFKEIKLHNTNFYSILLYCTYSK